MAKKGQSSSDSWNSPPTGYPGGDPRLYARLCVNIRGGLSEVWRAMPPFFRQAKDFFGDHRAEIHTLAMSFKNEAWASPLPWRQGDTVNSLRLPLSQFADPSTWKDVLECSSDQEPSRIEAHRGGGSTRHLVWSLQSESHNGGVSSAELFLATRHVGPNQTIQFRNLILAFFDAACSNSAVVGGHGEVFTCHTSAWLNCETGFECSDRLLLDSLRLCEYEFGQFPVIPRWVMVLSPAHLHQLGGIDAFCRRADRAEREAWPERFSMGEVPEHLRYFPVHRSSGSIVVVRHALPPTRPGYSGIYPGVGVDLFTLWLLDELSHANLLIWQSPDRMKRFRASETERLARLKECEREAFLRAARESGRLPKNSKRGATPAVTDFRTRRPRCIQGEAALDKKPPKLRDMNDRAVSFRLKPRGLEKALTIYGRASRDANTFVSPILVGSLDKDRATLYFDSRIHGFDGEPSPPAPKKARPIGKLTQFVCSCCAGRLFDCWAAFEHNDEEGVVSPDDEGRRQDLFDWFYLVARCVACNKAALAADIECA